MEGTGSARAPVLFVLDASGSMTLPFNGVSRMSAARHVLQEQIRTLPADQPIGLMAYGNGVLGCSSSRLYNAIEPRSGTRIGRIVEQMLPAGNTPLAHTLNRIRTRVLPMHPGLTVIVISDGAESCGGDPTGEARLLAAAGGRLHIIGLGAGPRVSAALRSVADAGAGTYRAVENDRDFRRAFEGPLASLRARRNYFLERKWNLHESEPADSESRSEFVITAVRTRPEANGKVPVEVDYRFRQKEGRDFFVKIRALPFATDPSASARVQQDERTFAAAGRPFYAASSGFGTAVVEVPKSALSLGPVFVQGELWRTEDVPAAALLSNSMPVAR